MNTYLIELLYLNHKSQPTQASGTRMKFVMDYHHEEDILHPPRMKLEGFDPLLTLAWPIFFYNRNGLVVHFDSMNIVHHVLIFELCL